MIDWLWLSKNNNDNAISLLKENMDKVNWIQLSCNSNIEAITILEKNIDFLSDFSKAGNYNLLDFAGRLAINEETSGGV